MRKKIVATIALCLVAAAPVQAIKFCPYTATLAVIGALEVARNQAPEYARPLRLVQFAAAGGFVAFTARFLWTQFSTQSQTQEEKVKVHEEKSHS